MHFWKGQQPNHLFSSPLLNFCPNRHEISSFWAYHQQMQWNQVNLQNPGVEEPLPVRQEAPNVEGIEPVNLERNPQIRKEEGSNLCIEKVSRNLKSNVVRDFIKSLKKNSSSILIAKRVLKSEIPIKKFMEFIQEKVPDEGKYIRFKSLQELCFDKKHPEICRMFRILLNKFFREEYCL